MTYTELDGMGSQMWLGIVQMGQEAGVVHQMDQVAMLHGKIGKDGISERPKVLKSQDSSRTVLLLA